MSKLSIKHQVLGFATFFLVLIVAFSGITLWSKQRLDEVVYQTADLVEQTGMINDLKEDLDQAYADALRVEDEGIAALDKLVGNLTEISDLAAQADAPFNDTYSPSMRSPETIEKIKALDAEIDTLIEDTEKLRLDSNAARMAVLQSLFLPKIASTLMDLDALQADYSARLLDSSDDSFAILDQIRLFLIGAVVAVGVLGLGASVYFGNRLSSPIQAAASTVERLTEGEFGSEVIDQERGDEIGVIARNLETLRGRLEQAKQTDERWKQENDLRIDMFNALGQAMGRLRDGDLSARIDADAWKSLGPDYVSLGQSVNELSAGLSDMVASLQTSAETVQSSSGNMRDMASDMSARAETQAATLEQSAAALNEVSHSIQLTAQNAERANAQVQIEKARAERGGDVMERARGAMAEIARSSEKITNIIGVIDDIAFQTNLLALNAGVEAARAGESGKGFSVVASEVRALAQKASGSAAEIKELVATSVQHVESGERLVGETGETLIEIVDGVKAFSDVVAEIAVSAQEQATGIQEVNTGVAELDKVTQANAAMVGEAETASRNLGEESLRLMNILSRYAGNEAATGGGTEYAPRPSAIDDWDQDLEPATKATRQTGHQTRDTLPNKNGGTARHTPYSPQLAQTGTDNSIWEDF